MCFIHLWICSISHSVGWLSGSKPSKSEVLPGPWPFGSSTGAWPKSSTYFFGQFPSNTMIMKFSTGVGRDSERVSPPILGYDIGNSGGNLQTDHCSVLACSFTVGIWKRRSLSLSKARWYLFWLVGYNRENIVNDACQKRTKIFKWLIIPVLGPTLVEVSRSAFSSPQIILTMSELPKMTAGYNVNGF